MNVIRTARAGSAIEDYCRACKVDRMHTVIAADSQGQPIRVQCGYCRSEHNYRGGPRTDTGPSGASGAAGASSAPRVGRVPSAEAFPIVSDREKTIPAVGFDLNAQDSGMTMDIETLLRRIIREESGITPVTPAAKWRGGTLILRPGTPGLQEKTIPIETFFHKVVMLRNRLRTLEQQVNASDLPDDAKIKLQAYISGCYGSLTTFNILFADEDDQFRGGSSD